MKLKFSEKLSYSFGDFSSNGVYMFTGTFLVSFLTIAMGLSGTVASAIIFGVTIFDIINDVVIGSIVDKVHAKGKKYTAVMRMSLLPTSVLLVLLFTSPNISLTLKAVYAVLVYSLFTIAYTGYGVTYGCIATVMTSDDGERIQLGAFRDWGANFGGFLINMFASIIILYFGGGEMNARGFFVCAVILGVVLLIGGFIPTQFCKERVVTAAEDKVPFKVGLKAWAKNRYAIIVTIIACAVNCAVQARASFTPYYATYCLDNANLISPILSLMSVVPLVAILFVPKLTQKLDRRVMFSTAGIALILSGLIESLGGTVVTSMIASVLCGVALCCSLTVIWGAVPDIVDYSEYLTGFFCPATIYALMSFTLKLAVGAATSFLGLLLDLIGFKSTAVTEQAINGIRFWYGLIPVVLGIVVLIAALCFNLTHKKIADVHAELAVRRGAKTSK